MYLNSNSLLCQERPVGQPIIEENHLGNILDHLAWKWSNSPICILVSVENRLISLTNNPPFYLRTIFYIS